MLIVGAIYFFGNFIAKKTDDEGPTPPKRDFDSAEEADAAERQRRIQDEIRRKIMERRREAEAGRTESNRPVAEPSQQERPPVTAFRDREQSRDYRQQPPPLSPTAKPASSGPFSWDTSDDVYEQKMEVQLKRIEETKRQAAKLKKQAGMERKPTEVSRSTRRRSAGKGILSGPVRTVLNDPAAARAAFVYGEVLGQPISMRKQSNVPGLS